MMDPDKQEPSLTYITEAQNGDFEAFRQLVAQYQNALLSVAFSVTGDFHEAQDATQEAFIKCYRQLHTLHDPAKLGSWLYSIAYRTSLDYAKKKKQASPYDDTIAARSIDPIEEWLDRRMTQEAVWNAIQSLEHKSKTAVVLHYISDWTMPEIGRFLQLSVSAVESRIRRARELLKRQLAGDYEPFLRQNRLDRKFEQQIAEAVLTKMGHFYVPVRHRRLAQEWFVRHFRLETSRHGNLLLDSGQELYLLECHTPPHQGLPLLAFAVSDVDMVWAQLQQNGVRARPVVSNEWIGRHFVFYDPDGNAYHAVENI